MRPRRYVSPTPSLGTFASAAYQAVEQLDDLRTQADKRRAHRLARSLEAGYIWVNGSARHFWGVPFGGVKDSGIGREESLEELQSFTTLKSVNVLLG